jgi:hypothetical protein
MTMFKSSTRDGSTFHRYWQRIPNQEIEVAYK